MSYYPLYYNLYNYLQNEYEEKINESNTVAEKLFSEGELKEIIDEYIKIKVEKILDQLMKEHGLSHENLVINNQKENFVINNQKENNFEKFSSSIILSQEYKDKYNISFYLNCLTYIILVLILILIVYSML